MDSPLPLEEGLQPKEAFDSTHHGGGRPAERDPKPKRGHVRQSQRHAQAAPKWQRHRSVIVPAALLGAAAAAVLVYVEARSSANDQTSVTTKIPDAASVGAAVNNLPPPNLLKPISPEEAVKENADRPFTDRPDTAARSFILKSSADDRARASTCLTQAIYYEAASEGADGGRAVAQVVLNRVRHPGYPASICGVVYEGSDRPTGCQFTFTCDGSLLRPHVDSLWKRSQKIAEEALAGHVFAPVGHATHYHADYVLPYWADSLDKTVQIGRHIFYRLRGSVGDSHSFFQRYAGAEPPIPAPRPATVMAALPTAADQQELAKVLIGEDSKGTAPDAEKVALAATPLLADAAHATLIADGDKAPIAAPKRAKSSIDCPSDNAHNRLAPLGANDVRSLAEPSGC